jgi:ubiquinol-cytochrome c reductase iron-sulfur subunit
LFNKFETVVLSRLKSQTGCLRQSTRTNCPSPSCPTYRPELGAADLGGDAWKGGFYCPCHGSKFDLAGRVYIDVPAPINLMIPPYHFVSDTLIQIGVSPEEHEVTPIFKSNKLT